MVVFGQSALIGAKVVAFGKSDCIRAGGCIRAKVVVLGENYFIPVKPGCIRAKVVLFGQSDCIWAKVVVFR